VAGVVATGTPHVRQPSPRERHIHNHAPELGRSYGTRHNVHLRQRFLVHARNRRAPQARSATAIPYGSDEWKRHYRGRSAVEREFGRLKNEYGLAPLRTRGIDRVRIHADLVMLARLGQALARARAVPLAA
jgi:hypothetical protein